MRIGKLSKTWSKPVDTSFTLTEGATLAHPKQLFEPRPYKDPKTGKEQGDPIHSATFLFDPAGADWKAMKQHALKVARLEWPTIKWGEFSVPFKNGDDLADKRKAENEALVAAGKKAKPDGEYQRGKGVMQARSKWAPELSGRENGKVVDYDTELSRSKAQAKFFFGAECVAVFNFIAGEIRGSKYVSVYVNTIMVTGKGKKIGGSQAKGSQVFAGYKGGASDVDPTGVDDEIPF